MKIKLTGNYKSLGPFESDELSKFSIITGENGSGKSQLIEQFEMHIKRRRNQINGLFFHLEIDPNFEDIYTTPLNASYIESIDSSNYLGYAKGYYSNFNNILNKAHFESILYSLFENKIDANKIRSLKIDRENYQSFLPLVNNSKFQLTEDILKEALSSYHNRQFDGDFTLLIPMLVGILKEMTHIYEIAYNVAEQKNKNITFITESDFITSLLPLDLFDSTYIFNSKLENIFYSYLRSRETYIYQKYKTENANPSRSEEIFDTKFINPFKQINTIFEELNLNYFFKEIKVNEYSNDAIIRIEFVKKSTNQIIPIKDISSGEKVIIDLVLKLFMISYYNDKLQYPDLIILDEPDAHLHPSMSHLLIKTLNDVFAKKMGIYVIMTTHSPSTIALAPEEAIFELKNSPTTSLKKISKDGALNILTKDLPNLSIDYKNHKQIFVEGETDQIFYTNIFSKHRSNKNIPNDFYFISAGNGENNCTTVKNTTNALRDANSKNIFGIIDWDLKNKPDKYIYVHGEGVYYSIENIALNPLYLTVLFLETEKENSNQELNLPPTEDFYELAKNENFIKTINDWFWRRFYDKNPNFKDSQISNIEFYSGIDIEVPKKYLEHKGHDLEEIMTKTFPSLNSYSGQGKLLEKLSKIICKCYPNVPKQTIEIFELIINAK